MNRQRSSPLLLVLASLLFACDDNEPAGRWTAGPTKVVAVQVEMQAMVDQIEALGTAKANESVEIRPRIASLVDRIAFDEGQTVKAGQLLVALESSEILAGLELAKANLSESKSLYERNRSLSSTQAISLSNLEQLLAQVKVDEAQVEAARARLANSNVRAPFTGRVGLRRVSPGSYVDASTVITTLDDVSSIKLDFSIPETFVTVVKDGMPIKAQSIVYPGREFIGTVATVDTRVDPVTRAVQVRAVIPNDEALLKPGMFMTVSLQRDQGQVLVAPEQAIVPEGSSQYVFVVNDGIAERRRVTLGARRPGIVVIRDGLTAGEFVVTEGTSKIRDGSAVEGLDRTSATITRPADES